MLTEMISKLDHAVLELALIDAFYDICFYEGEEVTEDLEQYLDNVDNKTNTEEQDNAFFEISIPYIEKSIISYSTTFYEGASEITTGADESKATNKTNVGADALSQVHDKNRQKLDTTLKTNPKKITEAEIWEGVGQTIYPAAKAGIAKAKTALIKTGKSLSAATTGGIINAQKKLQKHLAGFKIKGKMAVATPDEK